jgi:hypothetical protein
MREACCVASQRVSTRLGDARMLADLVRTDRHHHRPAKGDSGLAEAVKVLARGHQQLAWPTAPADAAA